MARALCSYTHPELPDADSRKPCRSLRELKQLLAAARQLQFCDICLEGRKVPCRSVLAHCLHACRMHRDLRCLWWMPWKCRFHP